MDKAYKADSISGRIVSKFAYVICHTGYVKKRSAIALCELLAKTKTFIPPVSYKFEKFEVGGVPVEKLTPKKGGCPEKVVLQLHGGGYIAPMADLYRKSAVKYSRLAGGATAFNIDYRVAPEHHYPAATEDAEKVYDYLLEQGYKPENILIAGDSAGGNLAMALVGKLVDDGVKPLPRAIVAMSPWADLATRGHTYQPDSPNINSDPMFGQRKVKDYPTMKQNLIERVCKPYAGDTPLDDPGLSPVYRDYNGFPPMLVIVGGAELLLADSETIVGKAKAAGVDATLSPYKGMFHVFPIYSLGLAKEGRDAWKEIGEWLKTHF